MRATKRLVGVNHNTLMNWVLEEVAGKALAHVKPDDLWTYLGQNTACWLWWAFDLATKKVCGWTLGDRGAETACCLDAQLPHAAPITFCTDFWHPYPLNHTISVSVLSKQAQVGVIHLRIACATIVWPPS